MKLEEHSLAPLYCQVMDSIREDIDAGRYAPGSRIPSEIELSELYSVSRITIRRAIEELAGEGRLSKKQGKGTYVNAPKLTQKIVQQHDAQSFRKACELAGRVAGMRVLACERAVASQAAAEFLGVAQDAELLLVRSLWTADGVPVLLESDFFPLERFDFLERELLGQEPPFDIIERHLGRRPQNSGHCLLDVVRASVEAASLLQVTPGEPLFRVQADLLDDAGRPLVVCRALLVCDRYSFDIV